MDAKCNPAIAGMVTLLLYGYRDTALCAARAYYRQQPAEWQESEAGRTYRESLSEMESFQFDAASEQ